MQYIPVNFSNQETKNNNCDLVFKFKNLEEAELAIRNALDKMYNIVNFNIEDQAFTYTDNKNKKRKQGLQIEWESFKDMVYLSISIRDEEGSSNLLETAIADHLTK